MKYHTSLVAIVMCAILAGYPANANDTDHIANLVTRLNKSALWSNGAYISINLPAGAKAQEVLSKALESKHKDSPLRKKRKVVEVREVTIGAGYIAVLLDYPDGLRVFLCKHKRAGWWSNFYKVPEKHNPPNKVEVPALALPDDLKTEGWTIQSGKPTDEERPMYVRSQPVQVIKLENRKVARKGRNHREPEVIFATITLYVYPQLGAEKLLKQRALAMEEHKMKLAGDRPLQEALDPSELFWQTKEHLFFMHEGEFLAQQKEIKEVIKKQLVEQRTASGILKHFPDNVRSAEAWHGHNFMVEGIPIIPTDAVSEDALKKHVGSFVVVTGGWNPGKLWEPTEEELNSPMPVDPDKSIVIIGDGIMASSIVLAKR